VNIHVVVVGNVVVVVVDGVLVKVVVVVDGKPARNTR